LPLLPRAGAPTFGAQVYRAAKILRILIRRLIAAPTPKVSASASIGNFVYLSFHVIEMFLSDFYIWMPSTLSVPLNLSSAYPHKNAMSRNSGASLLPHVGPGKFVAACKI
jgi:hypothetical protein